MKAIIVILFVGIGIFPHSGYSQDSVLVFVKNNKQINKLCVSKIKDSFYYAGNCNNLQDLEINLAFDSLLCDKYMIFIKKNGKHLREGYICLEYLDGYTKFYYRNGQLKSEGVYYYDEKIGLWKYYNKKGTLIKTEEFIDHKNVLGTDKRYPIID